MRIELHSSLPMFSKSCIFALLFNSCFVLFFLVCLFYFLFWWLTYTFVDGVLHQAWLELWDASPGVYSFLLLFYSSSLSPSSPRKARLKTDLLCDLEFIWLIFASTSCESDWGCCYNLLTATFVTRLFLDT